MRTSKLAKAEDLFRRAIEIAEAIGGERLANFTLSLVGSPVSGAWRDGLIEAQTLQIKRRKLPVSATSPSILWQCNVSELIPKILAGDIETALLLLLRLRRT